MSRSARSIPFLACLILALAAVAPVMAEVLPPGYDGSPLSPPERIALQWHDASGRYVGVVTRFGEPGLFSYYDYQAGRFHKRQGMRIDYILSTASLAARCRLDLVDRNARKGSKPSDHAPVVARFAVD